jgi:hypothetical protein
MTGGFICLCGKRMSIQMTRKPLPDMIRRYRVCHLCGLRLVTEERVRKKIPTGVYLAEQKQPPACR